MFACRLLISLGRCRLMKQTSTPALLKRTHEIEEEWRSEKREEGIKWESEKQTRPISENQRGPFFHWVSGHFCRVIYLPSPVRSALMCTTTCTTKTHNYYYQYYSFIHSWCTFCSLAGFCKQHDIASKVKQCEHTSEHPTTKRQQTLFFLFRVVLFIARCYCCWAG